MVLGRDQDIDFVGRSGAAPPGDRLLRHGRLEERGAREVRYDEAVGLVRTIGEREEHLAPRVLVVACQISTGAGQRDRRQLHEEGVHRVLLVRLHRARLDRLASGQPAKQAR